MQQVATMWVLYNAQNLICRTEIGHYAALAAKFDLPMRFDDLNGPEIANWGIPAEAAARQLHVLYDGRLVAGFEAFRLIWSAIPRYRWLARLTGWPGIHLVGTLLYDRLAAPLLYTAHQHQSADAETAERPRSTRH